MRMGGYKSSYYPLVVPCCHCWSARHRRLATCQGLDCWVHWGRQISDVSVIAGTASWPTIVDVPFVWLSRDRLACLGELWIGRHRVFVDMRLRIGRKAWGWAFLGLVCLSVAVNLAASTSRKYGAAKPSIHVSSVLPSTLHNFKARKTDKLTACL